MVSDGLGRVVRGVRAATAGQLEGGENGWGEVVMRSRKALRPNWLKRAKAARALQSPLSKLLHSLSCFVTPDRAAARHAKPAIAVRRRHRCFSRYISSNVTTASCLPLPVNGAGQSLAIVPHECCGASAH